VATLAQVQVEDEPRRRPLELRLYRRMFGYTGPYRATMLGLMAAGMLRAAEGPLIVWTLAAVINGPIAGGQTPRLFLGVAAYGAVVLATYATFFFRMYLALWLGEGLVHDLRNDIFEHLQAMTMNFFSKTRIGRIISRMTSDSEAVRAGLQDAVFITMVNAGTAIVAASIMVYNDRWLSLVVLCFSPVYFALYHYFKHRLSAAHRAAQESMSRVTAVLAESVVGVRVTQGFVRQDLNARMFGELVVDHAGYNVNVSRMSGIFTPSVELLNQVVVATIFVAGGYFVFHHYPGTDAANLILFYFLASSVLNPVAAIGNQYNIAVQAMAGAERVFSLTDRKPDFADAPDARDLPAIRGRVELRRLTFEYEPGKPVLHDVSFVAEPGQTVALVGHTGSGKTSIINLISKFYLPTRGEVLIDGHEIRKIKADSLHHQMGIVLQNNFLFTGTVMENIRIGKRGATDEEVIAAAKQLDTLDLIAGLPQGFHTPVGERGGSLSLGQRQLICFTRAMVANPRIIILDEATSAVDTMTEVRIQKSLAILLRGRTSFVVAHRLSTIRHAGVVLVLDHGRIVERGTHNELLATGGIYANLYQQFIQASQGR
jgi:ATP-binding cassette subfamily B protein